MLPKLFDVHTHAHFSAFEADSAKVIERAIDSGVWLANVGTQRDTSENAIKVAEGYREGVWATVGLHPTHTAQSYHDSKELGGGESARGFTSRGETFDYEFYKQLASHNKVVAIGECGLDYYRLSEETKKLQKEIFIRHIELAKEAGKPLMVHCRNAFADLIEILTSNRELLNDVPGIIHFMTGTKDDAKKLMKLGFSFSFGGVITFARDYDEVIRYVPNENILLETDAPCVAPVPYRGRRNEPSYVIEVAKKLGELKGISEEDIALKTTKNALKLFGLMKKTSRKKVAR